MAEKKKDSIKAKLSALKPSVPTKTRGAAAKKPPRKSVRSTPKSPAAKEKSAQDTPFEREAALWENYSTSYNFMGFPFVMFDLWQGIFKTYSDLAESYYNFLISMNCWNRKL